MDVVRRAVAETLPWAAFLSAADLDQLLSELVTVARGTASSEDVSPVAVLLAQWRHTAEVYGDPVLLDILLRESEGDIGSAAPPVTPRTRFR
jgi:hypothetical protein